MIQHLRLSALVVAAALATASSAAAAPIPFTSELPITGDDIRGLRTLLRPDEVVPALDFLVTLRVFEDDASTPERTIVYLAPFFTADTSQEVIGGQQIATDLLAYLDQVDALLAAIQGSHRRRDRLEAVRADYLALAERLRGQREIPDQAVDALLAYARDNPYAREIALEPRRIADALNQLPAQHRRLAIARVLQAIDRLQVPVTAEERARAYTDPVGFMLAVLPRVRAKLATLLFGVRHATFVSGLTAVQKRYLAAYRRVRPDVLLRTLPIHVLRALPASATLDGGGLLGDGVSAPEMIRGVNAQTGGVCGHTSACTVIVEYTEIGARSALLSTRGATIMPALFVGDVRIGADLGRGVTCDTAALRQRAPLPVGMGLLGERQLLRALGTEGVCRGPGGAPSRLAAAALLSRSYRNLLFDTSLLSIARRRHLAADIRRWSDRDGGRHLGVVGTVLRELTDARDLLLARFAQASLGALVPRFPAELIAGVAVAGASEQPDTARFDFDGVAIACWKRAADGSDHLSACPDNAPGADLEGAVAAGLESRDCGAGADLDVCAASIREPAPDDRGYLWTGL